jgi:hypothetical protein
LVIVCVAAAVTALVYVALPSGSHAPSGSSDTSGSSSSASGAAHLQAGATDVGGSSSTSTTSTLPPTTTTTTTDPGTLPQTDQFPASGTSQFNAEMAALWQGIVTGSVTPALPAFFPQSAYTQLKTGIGNPGGDWQNRLVADYALDISAAHALLGPNPSLATFVSVSVPEQYGHWIPAGVCANGIGYFEVANSRVVYQVGGETRSFGIASMISWRGVWYVVHLGAILRNGSGGIVDDPEVGPGTSPPSSTC